MVQVVGSWMPVGGGVHACGVLKCPLQSCSGDYGVASQYYRYLEERSTEVVVVCLTIGLE